jgi:hypothetical protein
MGPGLPFETRDLAQRLLPIGAAQVGGGSQRAADRRSLGAPEQAAAIIRIELDAAQAGRLAERHAGNGARNRRGDATRAAALATVHAAMIAGARLARIP